MSLLTSSLLQEAAASIAKKISQNPTSLTSRIYSRDLFEAEFSHALSEAKDMTLSSTDISILVTYLSRDKPILSADNRTIKLKAPDEETPSPITEQDTDIASLRTLITTMNAQVDALTNRVTQLNADVREAVARKNTIQAKKALRSKKLAESTLVERTATLSNLEEVFMQIEQAADQVSIVRVMESSSAVLKSLHSEVGGVEGVEGVVERLREEMDKVDEVGAIINEASAGKVDENEVEDELAELERVEREKVEQRERAEREKKEQKEREEREKKEEAEAEITRKRLQELEHLEAKRESGAALEESASKEEEGKTEDGTLQAANEPA